MLPPIAMALALNERPTSIPLEPYLRYQSTITASVGGRTGTFLFDTGEGVTAITPEFSNLIRCKPWGRITGFRMTGEALGNPHCDDVPFRAGAFETSLPSVIVLDINSLIGPGTPHVDGAVGLDAFAGSVLTIVPRSCIIVESPDSLKRRTAGIKALPLHIVRDAEGIALSIDGAVPTPEGMAWMELDSGNGGSAVIANYIAPLLGLPQNLAEPATYSFALSNGVRVSVPTRTRDLIMDGDIGARFLNDWNLSLDLVQGEAWMAPRDTGSCAT